MSDLPSFSTITLQHQGLGDNKPGYQWFGRLFAILPDGTVGGQHRLFEAWGSSPLEVLTRLEKLWQLASKK
jgi:hypothetical protein